VYGDSGKWNTSGQSAEGAAMLARTRGGLGEGNRAIGHHRVLVRATNAMPPE